MESYIGKETVLSCEMEGKPPPIITWSLNPVNATITVNGPRVTSSLQFIVKSSKDFGDYECTGMNILGSAAVTITVARAGGWTQYICWPFHWCVVILVCFVEVTLSFLLF